MESENNLNPAEQKRQLEKKILVTAIANLIEQVKVFSSEESPQIYRFKSLRHLEQLQQLIKPFQNIGEIEIARRITRIELLAVLQKAVIKITDIDEYLQTGHSLLNQDYSDKGSANAGRDMSHEIPIPLSYEDSLGINDDLHKKVIEIMAQIYEIGGLKPIAAANYYERLDPEKYKDKIKLLKEQEPNTSFSDNVDESCHQAVKEFIKTIGSDPDMQKDPVQMLEDLFIEIS